MAELRQQARWETANTARHDECARLAAELAARALEPAESFLSGSAEGLACELYRESIYWSLRSLETKRLPPGEASPAAAVATPVELERLWGTLDSSAPGAVDPALRERAKGYLLQTFVDFAELPREEQSRTARELRQVADALLSVTATTRQQIDAVWLQRMLRLGGLALVAAAVLVCLSWAKTWREDASDLAVGRAYRTSSVYGGVGCRSPAQTCSESPDYFFHTLEEDKPWVEIDLGATELISSLRIDNRKDCCDDRAVPLLIEVGTDQTRFKQVDRRDEAFDSWRSEFEPVAARYVRVRAARRTLLHLARVRVFSK
jgi:hypothetical protein